MRELDQLVIREFHRIYYSGPGGNQPVYGNTTWMGVPVMKCPLDLWVYQEILFEIRPQLIVETGTYRGGSALFLAHLCDLLGAGRVVTIDIEDAARPSHPRISYMKGSSADAELVTRIFAGNESDAPVLVVLDSDHAAGHVLRELELFSPHVTPGSYVIVEDTNINGHPVQSAFGPGPYEAVQDFLRTNAEFEIDDSRERFLMTFNPKGYLRRRPPGAPHQDNLTSWDDASTGTGTRDTAEVSADLLLRMENGLSERQRELEQVRDGLHEAVRQLQAKDEVISALQEQLRQTSEGFTEAMRQLRAKDETIAVLQEEVAKCNR